MILEFLADGEPRRMAQMIRDAVTEAGWRVISFLPSANDSLNEFPDGVAVGTGIGAPILPDGRIAVNDFSGEASYNLIVFLNENGVRATGQGILGLPLNTVRIRVGLKPEPYFSPKEEQAAQKRFEEMMKEMKDALERIRPFRR